MRGTQPTAHGIAHGTWYMAHGTWHVAQAMCRAGAGGGCRRCLHSRSRGLDFGAAAAAQQGSRLLQHNLKAVAAQKYRSFKAPALPCTLPVTNPLKYRGSWSGRRQSPCGQLGLGDTFGSCLLPARAGQHGGTVRGTRGAGQHPKSCLFLCLRPAEHLAGRFGVGAQRARGTGLVALLGGSPTHTGEGVVRHAASKRRHSDRKAGTERTMGTAGTEWEWGTGHGPPGLGNAHWGPPVPWAAQGGVPCTGAPGLSPYHAAGSRCPPPPGKEGSAAGLRQGPRPSPRHAVGSRGGLSLGRAEVGVGGLGLGAARGEGLVAVVLHHLLGHLCQHALRQGRR